MLDRYVGRHIDRLSADVSIDMCRSTCRLAYRPISRPIHRSLCWPTHLDRYIGRVSVDMSMDSLPTFRRYYGLKNRSKLFRGNTNIENWIPAIEHWLSISDTRFPNHGIENDTNWTRGRKIECLHRSLILNCLETQHYTCRNLGS